MKVAGINLNLKEMQLLKWLSTKALWLRHMLVNIVGLMAQSLLQPAA